MKYCDLHCDALTAKGAPQVTAERLAAGGCLVQCFAAFVEEGGFPRFCALADAFDELCEREGYRKMLCAADLEEDAIGAVLTSEGGAYSSIEELDAMYARGVRMAGFVWNMPTGAGFPNFPDYRGLCEGRVPPTLREGERGLTRFGYLALERMEERGIVPDVSHGSDALFWQVAARGRPFAASHSCAARVCPWARNLTDEQIAAVADCGGVVGLNFCADFLSADGSREGQRRAIEEHARAIVRAGGEDVLAIGSDFDGAPPNAFVPDPAHMPAVLQLLADAIGPRAAEKAARDNFLRLFRDVCGGAGTK